MYVKHFANVQRSNHLAGAKWSNGVVEEIRGGNDEALKS